MPSDFLDSHDRHFEDAERLLGVQRLANADHLFGMAVECGLKQLMWAFGMQFNGSGDMPADKADRKHADTIWPRFESYRSGHHRGAGFVLPTGNPFADWNVAQRYENQNNFDVVRVTGHQTGARLVHQLIKKAILEGLI